jgi:hypothetical protein
MVNHTGRSENLKFARAKYGQPSDEVLDHFNRFMIFHEDEGAVRWAAETPGPRAFPNAVCGTLRKDGYRVIRVKGNQYMAGRVAWFLHTGSWPSGAMMFADNNHNNFRPNNMWESGTEPPAAFVQRIHDRVAGKPEAQPLTPDQILAFDATNRSRYIVADAEMGADVSDEYMDQIHHYLGNLGVEGAAAMANEDAAALVLALG